MTSDELAIQIYDSRISSFIKKDLRKEYYLPINKDGFKILLAILNGNIRHALSYTGDYCVWCIDNDHEPYSEVEKRNLLLEWLKVFSKDIRSAFNKTMNSKAKEFFKKACELDSPFSYSEHSYFGFNTASNMKTYVTKMEEIELMQSIQDEEDRRRKVIHVTPKALIMHSLSE